MLLYDLSWTDFKAVVMHVHVPYTVAVQISNY